LSCGEEALFNWRDFPESSTEVKEHFAEVGAYTAILDLKDAKLEGAMLVQTALMHTEPNLLFRTSY
jgi:hypothetical protein